jgi:hypothetical protein
MRRISLCQRAVVGRAKKRKRRDQRTGADSRHRIEFGSRAGFRLSYKDAAPKAPSAPPRESARKLALLN